MGRSPAIPASDAERERDSVSAIAAELGYHPLALAVAVALRAKSDLTGARKLEEQVADKHPPTPLAQRFRRDARLVSQLLPKRGVRYASGG